MLRVTVALAAMADCPWVQTLRVTQRCCTDAFALAGVAAWCARPGLSIIACNLINNQPMTIAFTRILLHPGFASVVGPVALKCSTFAVILGSNLGANFTLIGNDHQIMGRCCCGGGPRL